MKRLSRHAIMIVGLAATQLCAPAAFAKRAAIERAAPNAKAQVAPTHAGGWLEEALALRSLNATQRKSIEALRATLRPARDATKAARKAFLDALALQAESGKIDRSVLDPSIHGLVSAERAERSLERSFVTQLHAILDAKQRAELADVMQSRDAPVRAVDDPSAIAPNLAKELGLTTTQTQTLAKTLDDAKRPLRTENPLTTMVRAHDAVNAFRRDRFAIDKVDPDDAAAKAEARIDKLVDVTRATVKVATIDQCKATARILRAHAATGRMAL